ncbi:MAG TPA: glycosyltransferase family 4 protein [Chthoniobacterales bacterium]|jgi:glycosyltransferase involved in cell wall biosynthesis|nr:glycosyltransferase family 4 protein [Chthoniobacterales bacterium]
MKITIVLGAFFPVPPLLGGAVEKVWFALGQEFVRRGHEVVQISRTHPDLPANEEIEGVRHLRVRGYAQPRSLFWLKWLDLLYSWRVRRILPPANILVTNTFWLPLLVRRKDRGLLYVHVQRGPKGQMRWYGHAARLCAVSRAIAEEIVAEAPQLRDQVRVLPNALPFRIDSTPGDARGRTILYVGRVHPEKGIELLLRALPHLPREILGLWKVRIVGPHEIALGGGGEPFLRRLQEFGARSGAEVEWCGKIFEPSALAAEYRSALLFAYPSVAETGEALPVAPLEAMAHGCAPFVSRLPCFQDYIADGVTGFVFDHRGAEPEKNLARRLTGLLGLGENQIRQIGEAARAQAAQFDVATVAQRYLEDFARLGQNHA